MAFPSTLIADEETKLIDALGAWVEKSMYGKKYMGTDRSTFIVDADGVIRKAWRKVKVPRSCRRGAGGRQGHVTQDCPDRPAS